MKNILILGGTGKLGKILIVYLLEKNLKVITLIRNPDKLNISNKNLIIIKGDVTNKHDLEEALKNVDIVISALGHGFRTKYPIQEKTLINIIPLMEKLKIRRFITVTGAALKTKNDSNSFTLLFTEKLFGLIDPYRINDARTQQGLLEKSDLDWTVVRTPVHKDGKSEKLNNIGYRQPLPWSKLSRNTIVEFILNCVIEDKWIKESPVIY